MNGLSDQLFEIINEIKQSYEHIDLANEHTSFIRLMADEYKGWYIEELLQQEVKKNEGFLAWNRTVQNGTYTLLVRDDLNACSNLVQSVANRLNKHKINFIIG